MRGSHANLLASLTKEFLEENAPDKRRRYYTSA